MDIIRKAKRSLGGKNKKKNETGLLVQYNPLHECSDSLPEDNKSFSKLSLNEDKQAPSTKAAIELPKPYPRPRPRKQSFLQDENRMPPQAACRLRKQLNNENKLLAHAEESIQHNSLEIMTAVKSKSNLLKKSNNFLTERNNGSPKPQARNQDDPSYWPIQQKIQWFDKHN